MGHFSNAKIHAMNAKRIRMKFKWVLLDLKAIQMNYQAWIILQDGGMLKVCVNLLIIYPWSASQLVGTQEEKTQRSSWHIFTSRKQCCRVNRSNETFTQSLITWWVSARDEIFFSAYRTEILLWLHAQFQPRAGAKRKIPRESLLRCENTVNAHARVSFSRPGLKFRFDYMKS